MNADEISAGMRFVVDGQGRVTSVVLTPELWHQVVEQLENVEDRKLIEALVPRLGAGPRDALRWSDVERDWA